MRNLKELGAVFLTQKPGQPKLTLVFLLNGLKITKSYRNRQGIIEPFSDIIPPLMNSVRLPPNSDVPYSHRQETSGS